MGGQALEVGVVHDDPRAVCCCFENVVPSTLVSVLLILGTCSAFPYSSMNREVGATPIFTISLRCAKK